MKMAEKENNLVWQSAVVILGLLVLGFAIHDWVEAPEVKEVASVCPVVTITEEAECPVCETCEVCKVYDSEFVSDWEQDGVVEALAEEEMADEDFKEDLVEWMNTEYSFNIEDVDDLEFNVEDFDVEWSDREDGEALVTVELKTSYILDGDEDENHTKRVVAKFYLEDEDLEEFDEYLFEDY